MSTKMLVNFCGEPASEKALTMRVSAVENAEDQNVVFSRLDVQNAVESVNAIRKQVK
jgi:hypothetical protein